VDDRAALLIWFFPAVLKVENPMRSPFAVAALAAVLGQIAGTESHAMTQEAPAATTSLRFQVELAPGVVERLQEGRLYVLLSRGGRAEPRFVAGNAGRNAQPMFARDVEGFEAGVAAVIDGTATAFPMASLARLPAGTYMAQAVLERNRDLKGLNMPGNLVGPVERFELDPARGGIARLKLDRVLPEEEHADSDLVKHLKVPSKVLSDFHGRPMFLRASVMVPRGFQEEMDRKYPLRVHIGGFGERHFDLESWAEEGSRTRERWLADGTPRFLVLHLDGAGPLGDPYQIDSENHGPFGEALTKELIPYVEREFRGLGTPGSRVLDGGSTGGWVSLALQVFYPDFFNGCWSFCPDSVDFRNFQLINIYDDENAYLQADGNARAACRETNGAVRYTMGHECGMEDALGAGDLWTRSGGQWGSWNATYGARGADGLPVPLWDPRTGVIDRRAAEHWKKYDLRMILERDWADLGPRLRGKLHIWVGEADNYFLEDAVHRLDAFLATAEPPYEGSIAYGEGAGHCWMGISEEEMLRQMAERTGARP
jgi:hypothetical protein